MYAPSFPERLQPRLIRPPMRLSFDASDDRIDLVNCAVCEQRIAGGRWFARINHSGFIVALCCPLCADTFNRNPGAYVRRAQTYAQAPAEPSG